VKNKINKLYLFVTDDGNYLNLDSNGIDSFSNLSKLTSLTTLILDNNALESCKGIEYMIKLDRVFLNNNKS
jgi:Leucine-rich repeat (LRR) protein